MIKWLYKSMPRPLTYTFIENKGRNMIFEDNEGQQYRGSGTVWYYYPQCKKCSSFKDAELLEQWQKQKWIDEDNEK